MWLSFDAEHFHSENDTALSIHAQHDIRESSGLSLNADRHSEDLKLALDVQCSLVNSHFGDQSNVRWRRWELKEALVGGNPRRLPVAITELACHDLGSVRPAAVIAEHV